jgi:hypothetical protein
MLNLSLTQMDRPLDFCLVGNKKVASQNFEYNSTFEVKYSIFLHNLCKNIQC